MPILDSILDHEVIGPAILQGRREGLKEGLEIGRQEGSYKILRRQLEKRFGSLPDWAQAQLSKASEADLDELALRVLDVSKLEELLTRDS